MSSSDTLILLTGATGFLGAHIARELLTQGYRVRGLRRAQSRPELSDAETSAIEWAEADLTDVFALSDAFEGVTHVIHAGAMVSFRPADARQMTRVNVEGTAHIVNLCLDFGVKKLAHISSIAALGRPKDQRLIDETIKWAEHPGASNYALSKHGAEMEVQRGIAEGLEAVILCPSVIIGAGDWRKGSGRFFSQMYKGLKFYPVGGTGFVDARDVARAATLLLDNDIGAGRIILNAANCSYKRLLELIAQAIGRRPPQWEFGPWLAEIAWRAAWLREKISGAPPLLTRESARAAVSSSAYDNRLSLQIPEFVYRNFEDTIRDAAAAFLADQGR
ncbi:MAG: NAD-dependent epimerase/dehydratase family protein [Saprospiraceae bacterium]